MRLPFRLIYSDDYYLPIGSHVFPAQKYRMIHDRLLNSGLADPDDFIKPQPAGDDDVRLVHTAGYVERLLRGNLSVQEEMQRQIQDFVKYIQEEVLSRAHAASDPARGAIVPIRRPFPPESPVSKKR